MTKPKSKHYTLEKYKYDYKTHTYDIIQGKDDTLFAHGKYPTKVTIGDLPPSFVPLWGRRGQQYIDSAGVTDLVYKPNWFSDNHLYRDDTLYIKYGGKLECKIDRYGYEDYWESADQWVGGYSMIPFVEAVAKYSGIDVSHIQQALHDKKIWYVRTNPTHIELSNDEIDFDVPVHFIYREDIMDTYTKAQQEQLLMGFCIKHKLIPVHTQFVLHGVKDIPRLKEEVLEYKKNNELVIMLVLHIGQKEGEQDLMNKIWSALHYDGVCVEDVMAWEK